MSLTVVSIVSADNEIFTVPVSIACMSSTLKNLIDELPESARNVPAPVPLVTGDVLRRVLEYCAFHDAHRRPVGEGEEEDKDDDEKGESDGAAKKAKKEKEKDSDVHEQFNTKFVEMDNAAIMNTISAANYLDIKSLLDLCCKEVARRISGKTAEEIRQMLNIKNDFTPEEENMKRPENEWSEEVVYGTKESLLSTSTIRVEEAKEAPSCEKDASESQDAVQVDDCLDD